MQQPDGYADDKYPNKVLCLKKAIHGLKQSGRSWNSTLDKAVRDMGFEPCESEPCIYRKNENGKFNFIAVYVDDIWIACSKKMDLEKIKGMISKKFKLVDNGNVKHFLGMEIERDGYTGSISVGHYQYISKLLIENSIIETRPASTPLDPGFQISCKNENCKQTNINWYQSLIGTLMYLAISTRPNILHSVCKLAQRNQDPHIEHEKAVKHIMRYLQSTKNLNLHYYKTGQEPMGFVDADWASCTEDRKSYTGIAFFLAGCAFSWESKKQPNIALSSTEAEFVALSTAAKEAIYLKILLKEIGCYTDDNPKVLCGDNIGAQHLAKNLVFHGRCKHIDVNYKHVREVIKNNQIELRYISTDKMPADILTKNLNRIKHEEIICFNLFVKNVCSIYIMLISH